VRVPRLLVLAGALAVATLMTAADCDTTPGPVPGRSFKVELHAPHIAQQDRRSQPVPGVQVWDGTDRQVDVQMVAPVGLEAELIDFDEELVGGACIFLDAGGQLGDVGSESDSSGRAPLTIVPATYDVAVAPECLLGSTAAILFEDLLLDGSAANPIPWSLPETHVFHGKVQFVAGDPIEGAVIGLYDAERPERHLGLTALSGPDGRFTLQVPKGTYHVLASTPRDGSVPIAPIRVDNQTLPYVDPENTTLVIRFPSFITATLSGDVFADDLTYTRGRVLVEGHVTAGPDPGQFNGGFFRAETATDAQGRFELEVPPGTYTIQVWPAYDDTDCAPQVADTRFCYGTTSEVREVAAGALVNDVRLQLPPAQIARIEVREPDGTAMVGATLLLRQLTAPHYAYRRQTSADFDAWVGLLPAALYEVEVIPTTDPDTGEKRYSRGRASLDLTTSQSTLQVYVRESDVFDGFVFGPGGEGMPDVRVLMLDPETDALLDETVTNGDEQTAGFFRGILPRP
jgi:hypothetical protein